MQDQEPKQQHPASFSSVAALTDRLPDASQPEKSSKLLSTSSATMMKRNKNKNKNKNKQASSAKQKNATHSRKKPLRAATKRKSFPLKLLDLVDNAEARGYEEVVSWTEDGKAILLKNVKRLEGEILPKYLDLNKFRSFTRQLNYWGFERTTRRDKIGAFHNPGFVRGDKSLLSAVTRRKFKGCAVKQSGIYINLKQTTTVRGREEAVSTLQEAALDCIKDLVVENTRNHCDHYDHEEKPPKRKKVTTTAREAPPPRPTPTIPIYSSPKPRWVSYELSSSEEPSLLTHYYDDDDNHHYSKVESETKRCVQQKQQQQQQQQQQGVGNSTFYPSPPASSGDPEVFGQEKGCESGVGGSPDSSRTLCPPDFFLRTLLAPLSFSRQQEGRHPSSEASNIIPVGHTYLLAGNTSSRSSPRSIADQHVHPHVVIPFEGRYFHEVNEDPEEEDATSTNLTSCSRREYHHRPCLLHHLSAPPAPLMPCCDETGVASGHHETLLLQHQLGVLSAPLLAGMPCNINRGVFSSSENDWAAPPPREPSLAEERQDDFWVVRYNHMGVIMEDPRPNVNTTPGGEGRRAEEEGDGDFLQTLLPIVDPDCEGEYYDCEEQQHYDSSLLGLENMFVDDFAEV